MHWLPYLCRRLSIWLHRYGNGRVRVGGKINSARYFFVTTTIIFGLVVPGPISADVALPEISKGKGDTCVAPVEIMRRDHMKILFAQRDRVVLNGIRDSKESLTRCIFCHSKKDQNGNSIPINAPGEFCESCHAYTSVQIDCFQCHAAVLANKQSKLRKITRQVTTLTSTGLKPGE